MTEPQTSEPISTKLERIARLARTAPTLAFRSLAHHIDLAWLKEAYRRTRKDGALGIDRQSADEYALNLEDNLRHLLDRAKSGGYRAPPVRRVYIPKASGGQRPLGIPTFEDKVLQRAVAMLLEAIYEQDFLDCSYGFRPRRSAHKLLEAFQRDAVLMHGGRVLELDIRSFFDSMNHGHLRSVLRRRVRDGVLLRLIDKWLCAGVLEDGQLVRSDSGTPQGGVISPLLANVFLHDVLDTWFERDVRPRLRATARLYRYADDAVLIFADDGDARRVADVLSKRFEKYGLTLHPEKTRLVEFWRPRLSDKGKQGGTFDLLGFTHYWGRSRLGKWIVKRRTAKDRYSRTLQRVQLRCRENRHLPIDAQQRMLSAQLRGHYAYFGITGNFEALHRLWHEVKAIWRTWLNRRSQRRSMPWRRMHMLLQRYPLPVPRVIRPWLPSAANP